MMRVISALLLLLACSAMGAPLYKAKPLGSGYLECPADFRVNSKGKTIFCDLSAAVYARSSGSVYYAADWWGKARRPKLFSMQWRNGKPLQETLEYHDNQTFAGIEKVEAMTRTENGQFLIASSSFIHTESDDYPDWMKTNSLVYWQDGRVSEAKKPDLLVNGNLLPADSVTPTEYASYLRNGMLETIHSVYPGMEFFKVEGLSALPNGRLAFGVREIGVHYTQSTYKNIILTTGYQVDSRRLAIGTEFVMLRDFEINQKYTLASSVGISSLEYDFNKNLLYMSTSYERGESDEDVGAYVWVLPMSSDGTQLLSPRLVRDETSRPYHFAHKAEAMAIDSQGRVILIADDDKVLGRDPEQVLSPRTQFSRQPWQSAYTVLRIVTGRAGPALPH